ncbi:MAG: phosphoserine phosphatase RsbX [Actinomycetota bacterium]|jgi:serine phosphatase RsbU (regulator of sigma subunit)|nr:phosphoserine phosphatase RsbX [Actinomycetota bacterium]
MSSLGGTLGPVEWSVAVRPKAGEHHCGDHYAIVALARGAVLAVIDGLGHGPEAAHAARLAADTVTAHAEASPDDILMCCHEELRRTRGAAVSLAVVHVDGDTLSWLGVGNVEGVLWPGAGARVTRRARLLTRSGVVGLRLPRLHTDQVSLAAGDLLVLATDGVGAGFALPTAWPWWPSSLATELLFTHGRHDDDALVLVARYVGTS